LMNAAYLLRTNPNPTEAQIREGMAGNICRCTGYVNIIEAIKDAAGRMRERGSQGSALA
ncbi:MAG TPA: 2Fe-2S iron-sulfur cluster-binding protein, partial [Dehalococcoidia bacterium]|nr:2Fe-2S iron-sulfur cluster-binding protein [Dehalococcoidia bacterium]